MKKIFTFIILIFLISQNLYFSCKDDIKKISGEIHYKDGEYTGESRSIYTNENYWGVVKIVLLNNKIVKIDFSIYDRDKNQKFDENYEKRYAGNQMYIEQCRKDWNGVLTYPLKLLEVQKISDVDSVTGATWSYNILKDSLLNALEKAKL